MKNQQRRLPLILACAGGAGLGLIVSTTAFDVDRGPEIHPLESKVKGPELVQNQPWEPIDTALYLPPLPPLEEEQSKAELTPRTFTQQASLFVPPDKEYCTELIGFSYCIDNSGEMSISYESPCTRQSLVDPFYLIGPTNSCFRDKDRDPFGIFSRLQGKENTELDTDLVDPLYDSDCDCSDTFTTNE